MQKYVIIVAGGKGSRMGTSIPKQFLLLQQKPVLMHTLEQFHQTLPEAKIILVLPEKEQQQWLQLCQEYSFSIPHTTTNGGAERFHSVYNGLQQIGQEGIVAIHDGVRPFVAADVIKEAFRVAAKKNNAIVAVPLKDSIRSVSPTGNKAEDRGAYRLIQTPQVFDVSLLKEAYNTPYQSFFTDDASVFEYQGHSIELVEGNYENIKLTTPEDLLFGEAILSNSSST
ncbi:2-C-methyl-D-erythritol 4-phosphate cytidylyltransferase [Algivirga pacifica]|uniref:2-C-methyl-D-erythritol 4-phosphate cytidylyltransferase n=1 Tax=Algivirga pacifica TaxID=1162670 RepID=A0ABP9D7X0_9BACT